MEFKINTSQILGAVVQAISYIALIVALTWRTAKRIATIESKVEKALEKVEETNERMEKTFDRMDRTFDKIDEKIDRRFK